MKLPKTIRILGHTYLLKEMENGRGLDGYYSPYNNTIFIHKGKTDDETQDDLWHEVLHAIDSHFDLNLSHQTIMAISTAQFAVMKDNPGLFDLKGKG